MAMIVNVGNSECRGGPPCPPAPWDSGDTMYTAVTDVWEWCPRISRPLVQYKKSGEGVAATLPRKERRTLWKTANTSSKTLHPQPPQCPYRAMVIACDYGVKPSLPPGSDIVEMQVNNRGGNRRSPPDGQKGGERGGSPLLSRQWWEEGIRAKCCGNQAPGG